VTNNDVISFVVIAYNEEANIAATLGAIMGLDDLGHYEIVVVDDGSLDRTAEIVSAIARQRPNVRLIALERNFGRGYARSQGIKAARGAQLATVDADILLPSDWLVRARDALRNYDAVGGTAVPDADVAYLYQHFKLVPRVVGHTTLVTGANALYRRAVFDVTEFDPRLREGEDSALNHAMIRAGLSCKTVEGLIVRHEEKKSFGTTLRWLYAVGRGATRQLFALRQVRMPDLTTIAFLGAVALGVFCVAQGQALLGLAIPVGMIVLASCFHVATRFHTARSPWAGVLAAIAVDSVILTMYFAGRVTGLTVLLGRSAARGNVQTDGGGADGASISEAR
jgi:glycosyltransferase involved in cell wall biosynthesis